MTSRFSRFHIVDKPLPRGLPWWAWLGLALGWLLSMGGVAWLAASRAAPGLKQAETQLRAVERNRDQQERHIKELNQQLATLTRSDEISRAANRQLQSSLAEREEEIASLRADLAFYERLVGSTSQRKGLNVHSIEFNAEDGGTWQYKAVLTQNLNRGVVSQGQMRFSVEGVRAGKLSTISWDDLHQRSSVPGQSYSFRYFQELSGSVMLPRDFTPQRVKVSLRGNGVSIDQTFDWRLANMSEGR